MQPGVQESPIQSSQVLPGPRQYDWWREAVSDTHLGWDLPRRDDGAFRARFRHQAFGQAQIVQCACDPCHGKRGRHEIAQAQEPSFGLLYILKGRESLRQAGREIVLEAGSFTLWDSTRPIDFGLPGELEKITLLLPQGAVTDLLPAAPDLVMRPISGRRGRGALFATHLRALAREGGDLPASLQAPILRATLDLLVAAIEPEAESGEGAYQRALRARIQDFILAHLDDPALGPEKVAQAIGISARQVHRLFNAGGVTLDRWIWRQRLQRCRDELLARPQARVSEIAFHWGFSDSAHFSRAFRQAFGHAPRDFRKTRAG
jgi:AraC family transcriptional activator of tynA and feaB